MLDKLKLYLEINDICDDKDIVTVGEYIQNNLGKRLFVYTKKGQILKFFRDLLQEKITSDEFLLIGDISSDIKILSDKPNHEALYQIYTEMFSLNRNLQNAIFVVDKGSISNFQKKNPDKCKLLIEEIEKIDSKLFSI